ncbi:uncharacterized protein [Ptychodera flava]|uniref:uncharacterized protein isoform X2 n=1 Tax=Ptychodera flava TaxID=63121 RepID=UPI00396A9345
MTRTSKQKRKKRPRKLKPVTHISVQNRMKSKALISKLHVANKEIEKLQENSNLKTAEKQKKLALLQTQVKELGGLDTYQLVSKLGEYHHGNTNTAKWVVKKIQEYKLKPSEGKRLDLLDVGALDLNYEKHKWINCTSIDLNPQNHKIIKADFLQYQCHPNAVYLCQVHI